MTEFFLPEKLEWLLNIYSITIDCESLYYAVSINNIVIPWLSECKQNAGAVVVFIGPKHLVKTGIHQKIRVWCTHNIDTNDAELDQVRNGDFCYSYG